MKNCWATDNMASDLALQRAICWSPSDTPGRLHPTTTEKNTWPRPTFLRPSTKFGKKAFRRNYPRSDSFRPSYRRYQFSSANKQSSSGLTEVLPQPVNAGVPQGSVVFPILFPLLTKDLLFTTSNPTHSLADGIALYCSF